MWPLFRNLFINTLQLILTGCSSSSVVALAGGGRKEVKGTGTASHTRLTTRDEKQKNRIMVESMYLRGGDQITSRVCASWGGVDGGWSCEEPGTGDKWGYKTKEEGEVGKEKDHSRQAAESSTPSRDDEVGLACHLFYIFPPLTVLLRALLHFYGCTIIYKST